MMSIGIWFIKRGENYAEWYSADDVEQYVNHDAPNEAIDYAEEMQLMGLDQ